MDTQMKDTKTKKPGPWIFTVYYLEDTNPGVTIKLPDKELYGILELLFVCNRLLNVAADLQKAIAKIWMLEESPGKDTLFSIGLFDDAKDETKNKA